MLSKLAEKYKELSAGGRLKGKWSAIEDYGMVELMHVIFDYDEGLAVTAEVDDGTVFLNLYEGIPYEYEGKLYTLAKAYIDTDNNIVFATPAGEMFMYETDMIDAGDPRHIFGNE
ncbi:MAG TPA: hypothetical protein VN580_00560 [Clostridia bacterium]|nr:hypothetical protein [Clostridia bacterium]